MDSASQLYEYLDKDVVSMLKVFKENEKVMKDYKIIGNKFGTTLVIRFEKPCVDTLESPHQPRHRYHKSPSAASRDYRRSSEKHACVFNTQMNGQDYYNCNMGQVSMPLSNMVINGEAISNRVLSKHTVTEDIISAVHESSSLMDSPPMKDTSANSFESETLIKPIVEYNDGKNIDDFGSVENWDQELNEQFQDASNDVLCSMESDSYKKYEKNIHDKTRNTLYYKFIKDPRIDRKQILGITDDLILDLNYESLRVDVITPARSDYIDKKRLSEEWGDHEVNRQQFSGVIHLFENALSNIVKDQQRKLGSV